MPMIQGIDGLKLIEAFRAGRKDRLLYQEADIKRRKGESELATEEEYRGLAGQVVRSRGGDVAGQFGARVGGGVADQYASPATTKQPLQAGESVAPMLDSSSPLPPRQRETVSALSAAVDGAGVPPAPSGSPSVPPIAPTTASEPPVEKVYARYDPAILRRMVVLKPQEGAQLALALKRMDETQIAWLRHRNEAMATAAMFVEKEGGAEDQRRASLETAAPHLREAGWTDEEIARANLTDAGLREYQGVGVDVHKLIRNEQAERRLDIYEDNVDADNDRADRNTDSMIGDRAARRGETKRYHDQSDKTRRRQDKPRTGRTAAPDGPIKVKTKEEAMALAPGTKYRAPDGLVRTR